MAKEFEIPEYEEHCTYCYWETIGSDPDPWCSKTGGPTMCCSVCGDFMHWESPEAKVLYDEIENKAIEKKSKRKQQRITLQQENTKLRTALAEAEGLLREYPAHLSDPAKYDAWYERVQSYLTTPQEGGENDKSDRPIEV